ncbi:MAG: hypothetical protein FJZ16_08625, partial [Candidatus Omnitrophica bacterium]|nr:hypothetical protein [Candidatus Omnitrophota bacterium]
EQLFVIQSPFKEEDGLSSISVSSSPDGSGRLSRSYDLTNIKPTREPVCIDAIVWIDRHPSYKQVDVKDAPCDSEVRRIAVSRILSEFQFYTPPKLTVEDALLKSDIPIVFAMRPYDDIPPEQFQQMAELILNHVAPGRAAAPGTAQPVPAGLAEEIVAQQTPMPVKTPTVDSIAKIDECIAALLDIARKIAIEGRVVDIQLSERNETVLEIKEYLSKQMLSPQDYSLLSERILERVGEDEYAFILASILIEHVGSLANFEEGITAPSIVSQNGKEQRRVRFALATEQGVNEVILKSPTFAPDGVKLERIPQDITEEQLRERFGKFNSFVLDVIGALREDRAVWIVEVDVPSPAKQTYRIEDGDGRVLSPERVIWPTSVEDPLVKLLLRGILEGKFTERLRQHHKELVDMIEGWIKTPLQADKVKEESTAYEDLLRIIGMEHSMLLISINTLPIFLSGRLESLAQRNIIQHELTRGLDGVRTTAEIILRAASKGEVLGQDKLRLWPLYRDKLLNFLNPEEFALDKDKLDFAHSSFPARLLLELIENRYKEAMTEEDIEFEVDKSQLPDDAYLKGQLFWMLRALIRFASNGMKFTSREYAEALTTKKMQISAKIVGSRVEYTFKDTGIGIPEDILQEIRANLGKTGLLRADNVKDIPGTGTAFLAASALLINEYGAEINIDSKVGEGTTVRVTLPLAPAEVTATPAEAAAAVPTPTPTPVAAQATITVLAELGSLDLVHKFIEREAGKLGFIPRRIYEINLAVDEAVTNVIENAYPKGKEGKIEITLRLKGGQLEIEIVDYGIAFNPLSHPMPDVTLPLEKRQVGGLGIYMILKFANKVDYGRGTNPDRNIFTLTFAQVAPPTATAPIAPSAATLPPGVPAAAPAVSPADKNKINPVASDVLVDLGVMTSGKELLLENIMP